MDKAFESVTTVSFPEPADRDINMMPFVLGRADSLPEEYLDYWPLISACGIEAAESGKIGYLTITKREVEHGHTQRRGGIHIERHPCGSWGGGGWGHGRYGRCRQGGLYMASNRADTTALWQTQVEDPGPGGDCSHLELGAPDRCWLKVS